MIPMTGPFNLGANNIFSFFPYLQSTLLPLSSLYTSPLSLAKYKYDINSVQHTLFKMPSYMELQG